MDIWPYEIRRPQVELAAGRAALEVWLDAIRAGTLVPTRADLRRLRRELDRLEALAVRVIDASQAAEDAMLSRLIGDGELGGADHVTPSRCAIS